MTPTHRKRRTFEMSPGARAALEAAGQGPSDAPHIVQEREHYVDSATEAAAKAVSQTPAERRPFGNLRKE